MDARRFDLLAQSLSQSGSRRGALRSLAGVFLAGLGLSARLAVGADAKKDRRGKSRKGKEKARRRKKVRTQAAAGCCSGGNCTPGPGKNLTKCCYEDQNLAGKSFKGSNLTGANFRGATLTNAKFQSANLSGACLVDADITGANFKGANQSGVIKCRTQTSSGIDNSGCNNGTACCQTCIDIGDACGPDIAGTCCGGAQCLAGPNGSICACPQGRTNCGGECVDLESDPRHCGACGNQCPAIHNAITGCGIAPFDNDPNNEVGFGCTYTCFMDHQNCDGDVLGTGCETPVADQDENCGFCGTKCGPGTQCCGCKCVDDPNICTICREVRSAKLIRTRG